MERERRDDAVKVEAAAAAARQEADRRRQEEVANAEQSRLNQVAAELEAESLSQEAKAEEVIGRQEAAKAEILRLNEAEKLQAERLRLDQLLATAEADQVRLNKLANEERWHQEATIIIEASRQQTIDLDKVAKAETDRIRQAAKVEAERLEREAERCRVDKIARHAEQARLAVQTRALAAGVIQGVYKGAAVRTSAMVQFARKLCRSYIVQLHVNTELNHAVPTQTRQVRELAAGVIQGVYKGAAVRTSEMTQFARKLCRSYIVQLHVNTELNHAVSKKLALSHRDFLIGLYSSKHISSTNEAVVAPDLSISGYSDDIAAVRPLDEPGGVGDFINVSNARIDDVLPEASPVSSSSSGRLLHQYSQSSFICDTTASPPPPNDLDVQGMLALGLSFESFMEAFESAYDDIGVAAAADALRVLAHEDGKWKTKATLHQVATLMQAKACDPDIWTEEVNACCMWLLKELLAN
ncbi:hypothetical protein DYB31_009708 [Aphanomyces astaci]|nr:hypothetical protein DYB31_009708 [Aphanomyces astaci]